MDSNSPLQISVNDFTYTVPVVASDGTFIQIREGGSIVDILTIQLRSFNDNNPKIEVVSAVRLPGGVSGLKKLKEAIEEQLTQFENREP